jgi:hypothetical protein
LRASAGAILAATAATFPFAMATSRTALIWFRASMTCPPFSRRSYFCCADPPIIETTIRHIEAAIWSFNLIAQTIPEAASRRFS